MAEVKSTYHDIRANVESHFSRLYQHAVRITKEVDEHMDLHGPRTAGRQRRRANAPADEVQESYRPNIAVPFLDHIITELDEQFSGKFILMNVLHDLITYDKEALSFLDIQILVLSCQLNKISLELYTNHFLFRTVNEVLPICRANTIGSMPERTGSFPAAGADGDVPWRLAITRAGGAGGDEVVT